MRINKENVMLKEEFDARNLGEELAILKDLETYYRGQVQVFLTEGDEDEAMKWDKMANDVADQIETLEG